MGESKRNVQIGLVQMSCTSDTRVNFDKAVAGIREAAKKVHRLFVCRSYSGHCISVMLKITIISIWQSRFRVRLLMHLENLPPSWVW